MTTVSKSETTVKPFDVYAHIVGVHQLIALPTKRIGIVIPSTQNININSWQHLGVLPKKYALPAPSQFLEAIRKSVYGLLSQFGGFTSGNQFGGWRDSATNELIVENGEYVWAYAEPTKDDIDMLIQLAQAIKAMLNQDNVLIIVDDKPYLV